jgi:hypothetical protein
VRVTLLLWLACLVMACGAAQPPAAGDRLSVDRLYPLRSGAAWSYDVDTGMGPPVLAVTRVTAVSASEVEMAIGASRIRYERRPEGLYWPDRQAFVLRAPLHEGARWDAGKGATAEVRSVDRSLDTPAGHFQGCVEIVESGGEGEKVVRTVFCPDVGPVVVESSMVLAGEGSARVVARLRGFTLGKAPPGAR